MSRIATSFPSARVFVIEDDAAVRDSLLMVLRDHGFTAEGFGDGNAFLGKVQPTDQDTIVLDLDLPGLSGSDIAAVLRARNCKANIAVISGLRASAFERSVELIKPIAAFRKPLDPGAFLSTLTPSLAR